MRLMGIAGLSGTRLTLAGGRRRHGREGGGGFAQPGGCSGEEPHQLIDGEGQRANHQVTNTLAAPRTRTYLPPKLSFKLPLTRSAALRS